MKIIVSEKENEYVADWVRNRYRSLEEEGEVLQIKEYGMMPNNNFGPKLQVIHEASDLSRDPADKYFCVTHKEHEYQFIIAGVLKSGKNEFLYENRIKKKSTDSIKDLREQYTNCLEDLVRQEETR